MNQQQPRSPAALVTGGATRVGARFSLFLAEQGYDIALHYHSSEKEALKVAEQIRSLGRQCEVFKHDFATSSEPGSLIKAVLTVFPRLNLLVNSASVYDAEPTLSTSLELLENQFKVNFFTPYLLTQGFAEQVETGNIINILDNKIEYQQYHYSAYLLSKKTLAEFTKMAAMEFAPRIRVNGIAPGVILPADVRTDDYIEWRKEGIPMKTQGSVDHLCQAMGYLLANDFVVGQILFVDGGEGLNHIGRNSETYSSDH
ncbi:MAG: SDR family NAD(P)-dependent oxidoreductase [Spongiibacteraceae bacterium]